MLRSLDSLDPDLARALAEHSPRLVLDRPALVAAPDSPTGWLLVEPAPCPAGSSTGAMCGRR